MSEQTYDPPVSFKDELPDVPRTYSVGEVADACDQIGAAVDSHCTGSKRVTVRVAALRKVLAAARHTLKAVAQ